MSTIQISDLITDAENTDGVFDVLMKSVEDSLEKQYAGNKLTGTAYAEVYLGAIQTMMQQSIAYVLGIDIANAQAALLAEQLNTEKQNAAKIAQDVILATNQGNLILKQIEKTDKEMILIGYKSATELKNALKVEEEIKVLTAQEAMIAKQILTEVQQALLVGNNVNKTVAEKDLIAAKALTEAKVLLQIIQDTTRSSADTLRINSEKTVIDQKRLTEVQQTDKVTREGDLLQQKTDTEKAQILDTVNGLGVKGMIGKQKDLYTAQTKGFARDAEQKLLKIMMDGWSVHMSTSTSSVAPNTGVDGDNINAVASKAITNLSA